ncbi:MAG: geranylgeranylglycerol-phosphate geranylgeranyltransferase [Roseivirga sp.]
MQLASLAKPSYVFNYLKMIRALNLVMVGLTQYVTAIFLLGGGNSWQDILRDKGFLLMVSSTVIITSAGYLINDYYDIKIDYVNKPQRVQVGRLLKRRWVIAGHTVLNLLGIAIGFYISPVIGIINFGAAFFLWLYSNLLKRLPFVGNLVIALLTGTTLFLVGEYFGEKEYLIFTYAVFAAFITLIREIIKDMEDLKGDEKFGCKTLPIIWGIANTKKFIYLLIFVFGITVMLMIGSISVVLPIILTITLIFLIFALAKADTVREFHRLSTFCKVIMLLGVISMIWI